MVQLAFASSAFRRFPLVEAMSAIKAAGYDAIEIMCDAPHAYPPQLTASDIERINADLTAQSLSVSNLNAFMMTAVHGPAADDSLPRVANDFWLPSYVDADPADRRKRIDHTIGALALAAKIGAPTISIEPGGPLDGQTEARAWELFADAIAECAEHAERHGVVIGIEPEPGLIIERTDQYLRFMERVSSPMVGMNLDVGHLFCVGEDPADAARRLGPHVRHIQIEDIAASREHRHLAPGAGVIDFAAFRRALDDIDYDGFVTVELYPYLEDPSAAARQSLEHLRALGY
ncbi:MAG: sugar phosphate isomerase/epimerase [Chloroflexi bacterium]|nr:sugar phosphate isomerase/epimerase [Chloroflexota bacterium]